MDEKESTALIPRPSGAVEKSVPGMNRILSGMVSDTLALASREHRSPKPSKFLIGDYEWCEPDYRQILVWAGQTGLKPEEVIAKLFDRESLHDTEERWYKFHNVGAPFFNELLFADGRFLKVNLNLRLLRDGRLKWVDGLEISCLNVSAGKIASGDFGLLPLSKLVALSCCSVGLSHLDLGGVPQLEYLDCMDNRLRELPLGHIPNLTNLQCGLNELTELELGHTPNLHYLDCSRNRLAELNLYDLHRLKIVFCDQNRLRELKLSSLPNLNCG